MTAQQVGDCMEPRIRVWVGRLDFETGYGPGSGEGHYGYARGVGAGYGPPDGLGGADGSGVWPDHARGDETTANYSNGGGHGLADPTKKSRRST